MKEITKYLRDNKRILFAYRIASFHPPKHKRHFYYPFDIAFFMHEDEKFFQNKMEIVKNIRSMPKAEAMWLYCLNTSPLKFQYEIICKGKVLRENKRHRLPFEEEVFKQYVATKSFFSEKKGTSPI